MLYTYRVTRIYGYPEIFLKGSIFAGYIILESFIDLETVGGEIS